MLGSCCASLSDLQALKPSASVAFALPKTQRWAWVVMGCSSVTPPKIPRYLKRTARKSLDVVIKVENTPDHDQEQRREHVKKATKLLPDTLIEALRERIAKGKWRSALKVFDLLREQIWYQPDHEMYVKLLVMLGKSGQSQEASKIFRLMLKERCSPRVESLTALMSAHARNGNLDLAFEIFEAMKRLPDCRPDIYTFTILFKACLEAALYSRVTALWEEMRSMEIKPSTVTYNVLINAYGSKGMFVEMEDALVQMLKEDVCRPDSWTLNAILKSFALRRRVSKMEVWFEKFQCLGVQPSLVSFHILLTAYAKEGSLDKIHNVISFMRRYHYPITSMTYNILIGAYKRFGHMDMMEHTFKVMKLEGVKPNAHTYSTLIDVYGDLGQLGKVKKVLREMRNTDCEPDTPLFNATLNAYRKLGDVSAMDAVYREMIARGCHPDAATSTILEAAHLLKSTNKTSTTNTLVLRQK